MSTRKVLISPGYGTGWSTSNSHAKELATDPELVRLVEQGQHLGDGVVRSYRDTDRDLSDASLAFIARAQEIVGKDADGEPLYVCFLGVSNLRIVEVDGPFMVEEYDGYEGIKTPGDMQWM